MIFQFEIVGYPMGNQGKYDTPHMRILTVEAPDLFEAYKIAKDTGKRECGGKCKIRNKS